MILNISSERYFNTLLEYVEKRKTIFYDIIGQNALSIAQRRTVTPDVGGPRVPPVTVVTPELQSFMKDVKDMFRNFTTQVNDKLKIRLKVVVKDKVITQFGQGFH